jgi:predicted RNA binding protein YcfA (HicA-like mRNA interferase family)
MPHFGPIKRSEFIRALRIIGFSGPLGGGKHEYMKRGNLRITIPNPHGNDFNTKLINKLLKQAGISRDEWENI